MALGRATRGAWAAAAPLALLAVVALAATYAVVVAAGGVFGSVVRSPMFVRCGLIALGCAALLALIGRAVWIGRQRRVARGGTDGTATVEFALVIPIALCLALLMIQAMMMMTATVIVNYSAYAAARTAIVWVPKDLAAVSSQAFPAESRNVVADPSQAARSQKITLIQAAASNAVLPICGREYGGSSGAGQAVADGVRQVYAQAGENPPNWVNSMVDAKFTYGWNHTTVELDGWPGSDTPYADDADLTVFVTHEYALGVPYAAALFGTWNGSNYVSTMHARCTLTNEGVSDVIEEDSFSR